MSIAEISKLPLREKFQIMEAIWQDLDQHLESVDAPPEHLELLARRRARVAQGDAVLLDWDTIRNTIGQR
jgi:hypothetical protein